MAQTPKRRPPRDGMSWEQMDRATLAADRAEFEQTTPGQRVEAMLELIRETAELAARGRARNRRPR